MTQAVQIQKKRSFSLSMAKLGFSLSSFLLIIIFILIITGSSASLSPKKVKKCPGRYCGRTEGSETCGACPRGYRPDSSSICQKCDDRLTFYDALYLGFMGLLSLVLHWFFIDYLCPSRSKRSVIILHLSALVESVVAALVTLVLADPVGSLEIRSCRVQQLSDWYTMLYNPSPKYIDTLHCTQEVVYPLYTIVMIYYAFSLVLMMLFRPFLPIKSVGGPIYAALYFLPALIVCQATCGGLIYYSFPYIILVVSVVTNAVHFASMEEGSIIEMIKLCFTNARHAIILFGHWLLHAYGIVALTRMETLSINVSLIALIPFPAIFYILTVSFTDPSNLDAV
ncbi:JNK1/MAPK8-associated membrane protein-like [Babylonia areolata]|uniref:JNK1/MAPK8-associated membrane protein-like n=1 Tax=Babylonia areolata TaxID=304850 RepID=UPI003FD0FBD3